MRIARSSSTGLDAAYRFFMWLCQQAKTSNYKFVKHVSDWLDEQQLYYLADPQMFFLTSDTGFSDRVGASSQAARIVTYSVGRGSSLKDVLKRALESARSFTSPSN